MNKTQGDYTISVYDAQENKLSEKLCTCLTDCQDKAKEILKARPDLTVRAELTLFNTKFNKDKWTYD